MTTGVLCFGNLVRDIAVSPVSEILWGGTTWVDSIEDGFGGNGANTSYTLAKLGVPVRLAGMAGDDDAGDRVLAILQSAGVDTAYVRRSSLPTPTTVALVQPGGQRALLHLLGASKEAFQEPLEWTAELTRGCSWFISRTCLRSPHCARALRTWWRVPGKRACPFRLTPAGTHAANE